MGGDQHGCVLRNCEEGYECHRFVSDVDVGYCDFEGPFADDFGCAWRRCDEPESPCNASQLCEPAATFADARGCRPMTCAEGVSCGTLACDPSDPNADSRGCVTPPDPGSGGAGGTGGTGSGNGGSASGQGGTAAAGQGGASNGGSVNANGGRGGIGAGGGSAAGGTSGASGSAGTSYGETTGRCVDR
jgi:hypothetical protein